MALIEIAKRLEERAKKIRKIAEELWFFIFSARN
jgi:hypothetical protein